MKQTKLLWLCFTLLLFSCSKEAENVTPKTQDNSLIKNAMNHFKENILTNTAFEAQTQSANQNERRQHLIKNADWSNAKTVKLSIGEAVQVPLTFSKELYAQVKNSQSKLALSSVSYLLLYRNTRGWQTEVVTRLPDADYLENKTIVKPFTGIVLVEDWLGNFIRGYQYGNNGTINKLSAPGIKGPASDTQVMKEASSCTITDWYSVSGGYSHYMYSEMTCIEGDYGSGTDDGGDAPRSGDYGTGIGSGIPDEDTIEPAPPSSDALAEVIEDKPYVLINDIPCELVKAWVALANAEANAEIKQKVKSVVAVTLDAPTSLLSGIPTNSIYVSKVLDIDNAYSSVVNLDYFSVNISTLPIINGQRATPQQLLAHIRTNLNSFVDPSLSSFAPYNYYGVNDTQLWNSINPIGAIISIDIEGPDNGSVIVSNCTPTSWTFSTIKDPYNGTHPVSGNREFGYTINTDGSYTFYTKGVDRLTDIWGTMAQSTLNIPFDKADALWMSFQNKISAFVNNNNGKAVNGSNEQYRPDWTLVKQVRDGIKPLSSLSNDCK